MVETLSISNSEFKLIAQLVYSKFGINLTDKKKSLVAGRLNKVIRSKNLSSFKEYYRYIINDETSSELLELIDHISTNHSYFNREKEHFEFLRKKLLPDLLLSRKLHNLQDIRAWCAGCANGEEAYTLTMVMNEFALEAKLKNDSSKLLLATDISTTALANAQGANYGKEKLRPLKKDFLLKYLLKVGDQYQIKAHIKNLILFKRFNLMNERFPFRNKFDFIFCRNVMIYFDSETRQRLIKKFYDSLEPGGYLFIGHSETIDRRTSDFQYIQPAIYRKPLRIVS